MMNTGLAGVLTGGGAAQGMLQVEAAQAGLHRGLAVGRGPCRGQPAIAARTEMEGALARFLEDKLVIDHPALAAAPFGRLVLVDAGPDRVDAVHIATVHILDGEKDLTAVRIKAVPRSAAAAARNRRGGAGGRRRSGPRGCGVDHGARVDQLVGQAQLGARRLAPCRLAVAFAFDRGGVDEVTDAIAKAAQEKPGRRSPMAGKKRRLIDDAEADLPGG